MARPTSKATATHIWRGGERLELSKAPDRFTVRLKRGQRPQELAAAHGATHRRTMTRQRLEEFAVDAALRDTAMDRIRAGEAVEFASHVYSLADDPSSELYLGDQITVQFRPDASDDQIEELTVPLGLAFVKPVRGLPHCYVFRVTSQASENPIKIANRLKESDKVLVSEPNVIVAARHRYTPTDSLFTQQWHLHHNGGVDLAPNSHIDAVRAWDVTRGERAVIVAIADDSVDLAHVDFKGPGKVVAPRDFQGNDFEPLPELPDDNHGTACAGVAVAEENGSGVIGVAPGAALMPIRTTGMLDDESIDDLFDWIVEKGASVVSCSWGPAAINFPLSLRQSNALHQAATTGRNGRGCVIVFAAGNSNRPVSGVVDEGQWPNDLFAGPTRWHDGFAAHPDVITVAASTSRNRKSAYSNWGDEVAVCAPSNNGEPGIFYPGIGDIPTYPRITVSLPGRGVVTTDRVGQSGYESSDYTTHFGGTSSACPVVAGVAALVLSSNPALTAKDVKDIIQATADKMEDPNPDPQLGNTFGSYDANGRCKWFGHGRVNAFQAVTEAVRRKGGPSGSSFQKEATPQLAIPDNAPAGVSDTISVPSALTIAAVAVVIDITHTYIGDLRVLLTAPSGTTVVLHDRNGGNSKNLNRTFDSTSTPSLSALVGQAAMGGWRLQVQDLAAVDTGRLNRWELRIDGNANAAVDVMETPGTTIPDADAQGIERSLSVPTGGLIRDIEVSVDITHTYIGDLVVELVAPSGTAVVLHSRSGGSADNLIKKYTTANVGALLTLRGQSMQGTWKLRVSDREAADVGKLNRWAIHIVRQA